MSIEPINVCLIGFGRAGKIHQNSILSLPGMRVSSVVDPNLSPADKKLLETAQITWTDQLQTALSDSSLQAAIVCCPTPWHYPYIQQALKAGLHVFSEKPLGKTLEEITSCYALARAQNKCLYLGFQRRYDPNFQALKQKIGEIAPLRLLKASSRDNPQPSLEYLTISGNIFHDMVIHDFDMMINLLGERIPESISAFAHAHDPDIGAIPDFDTVVVTIKYPQGVICSVDTSRTSVYGYDQRLELFGAKGMLSVQNQRQSTLESHSEKGMLLPPFEYSFPERYRDCYRLEILDFIQGIQEHKLHNIPQRECVLSHLMAEAAYQSVVEERPINFRSEYGIHLKMD